MSSPDLTRRQKQRGMLHAHIGQSTGLLVRKLLVSTSVGPLFVKAMGGTDVQAMLLGGVVFGGTLLRIPVSLRVPQSRGKSFMLRSWAVAGGLYALALAVPALMSRGTTTAWVFLALAVAGIYCQHAGSAFWWPLLHDVVPQEQRGSFFGVLRTIWQLVLFLAVISAGAFLGASPPLWKFQAVLLVAVVLMLCRNFFVARIPERDNYDAVLEAPDWKSHLKRTIHDRKSLLFFGYFLYLTFFANFFHLPIVLYMNNRLGFSVDNNTMIFGLKILGMVLALFSVGRVIDRIGTKRVFLASQLLLCVVAFATVALGVSDTSHARIIMAGILILSGITIASANLAATAQVFHLAPIEGRALFMNTFTVSLMVGYSLAPLTAGVIVDSVPTGWSLPVGAWELGIYEAIFAVSGLMLLAGTVLLWWVEDMRGDTAADGT